DHGQYTVATDTADNEALITAAAGGVHADTRLEAGDVVKVINQLLLDLLRADDRYRSGNVIQRAGEVSSGDSDFLDLALGCLDEAGRQQAASDGEGDAIEGKRGCRAWGWGHVCLRQWHLIGVRAAPIISSRIITGRALPVNRN